MEVTLFDLIITKFESYKTANIITIQEFNNLFAYTMDGILQGLYGFSDTSIYWILGLSFVFHIISLIKLFDNRAKNEVIGDGIEL